MKTESISFSPADNRRLSSLCGALDENLRQIEVAMGVSISRRGEHFAVKGEPEKALLAVSALEKFYLQTKGRDIDIEEIQLGLVELLSPGRSEGQAGSPMLMTRKSNLHGRTPRQAEYLECIQKHDITFGIGPAGTGKTYLAVASAVDAIEREWVKRIVLVRPAVEAGERLGFLPGDMAQKIDPYLRPLYDALYDLMGFDRVGRLFESGAIEVAPLAYMRGRTLNHSFIILDEAQNTTPEQMKMFLTRMGFGSRAVITGDVTQVDLAKGQRSGLNEAIAVLRKVPGIAFTHFQAEDVVRHPLVQLIVNAYQAYEK